MVECIKGAGSISSSNSFRGDEDIFTDKNSTRCSVGNRLIKGKARWWVLNEVDGNSCGRWWFRERLKFLHGHWAMIFFPLEKILSRKMFLKKIYAPFVPRSWKILFLLFLLARHWEIFGNSAVQNWRLLLCRVMWI